MLPYGCTVNSESFAKMAAVTHRLRSRHTLAGQLKKRLTENVSCKTDQSCPYSSQPSWRIYPCSPFMPFSAPSPFLRNKRVSVIGDEPTTAHLLPSSSRSPYPSASSYSSLLEGKGRLYAPLESATVPVILHAQVVLWFASRK